MQPKYQLNKTTHLVTPVRRADAITLEVDGHRLDVRLHWHDGHHGELTLNGAPYEFYAAQDGNKLFIHFGGRVWQLGVIDEFGDAGEGGAAGGRVRAPMPGVVVEVYVVEGDSVAEGDSVMLIESMKLQTEIKASLPGTVKAVGAEPGASFDKGDLLIDIDAGERRE